MSEEKQIAIQNLEKYIQEDVIYNGSRENLSDFDEFCINHCLDIQIVLELVKKQDKMINLMAEFMKENLFDGEKMYICNGFTYEIKTCACMNENESCKEKIKEQFRKKGEND